MRFLRQITLLTMLVALLPWGAYAAAFSATARQAALGLTAAQSMPHHLTADRPADTGQAVLPAPRPTIALAAKKCRTATLPGFSCAGDPVITPAQPTRTADRRGAVLPIAGDWTAESTVNAPPTGPPRSI